MLSPTEIDEEIRDIVEAVDAVEVWRCDPSLLPSDPPVERFYVVVTERRGYEPPSRPRPRRSGVHFMIATRQRLEACGDDSFGKIAMRGAECVWRRPAGSADNASFAVQMRR
jgi:hypothetical protein